MVDCVLVTGGSRNIGRGICERLTEDGHTVVQFDVLEPENPGPAIFVKVDLSNEKATADALTTLSQQHRVTRLVNNVGISSVANVEDVSLDEFDRVIRINTRVALQCAQAAVPGMKAVGFGRIVNIASIAGKEGNPGLVPYSMSKAALIGMTKAYAKEVATRGILVNSVAPAVIETEILAQVSDEVKEYMISKIPMGRVGQPGEVAELVLFLSSERCSFSTGFCYDISGGRATY